MTSRWKPADGATHAKFNAEERAILAWCRVWPETAARASTSPVDPRQHRAILSKHLHSLLIVYDGDMEVRAAQVPREGVSFRRDVERRDRLAEERGHERHVDRSRA